MAALLDSLKNHTEVLVSALEVQIKEAEAKFLAAQTSMFEAQEALRKHKEALSFLRESVNSDTYSETALSPSAPQDYDSVWTWEKKIEYILTRENKGLTTAEVAEYIMTYEPNRERKKVIASLSAVLSTKSKENGLFVKGENSRGENTYEMRKFQLSIAM